MGTNGLLVTGTDTDVGKTFVACQIAAALRDSGVRVGVYKPVASGATQRDGDPTQRDGNIVSQDAWDLWQAAGRPRSLHDVCPQTFRQPLAPPLAARAEGRTVDRRQLITGLRLWRDYEFVIVEGAGGLLSPIADDYLVADLAEELRLPVLIVAANRIGVINQTLQTLTSARARCPHAVPLGIVLNDRQSAVDDPSRESNLQQIRAYARPSMLLHVGYGEQRSEAIYRLDWRSAVRQSVGLQQTAPPGGPSC